jgi:hypothetical protein
MSNNDPWYRCPPGTFGRPDGKADTGPRFAKSTWFAHRGELRAVNEDGDSLYERAAAAVSFGDDSRFRRLAARLSRMLER